MDLEIRLKKYFEVKILRKVYDNNRILICAFCDSYYYIFDKNSENLKGAKINGDNIKKAVEDSAFAEKYFDFVFRTTAPGIWMDFDPDINGEAVKKAANYLIKNKNTERMDLQLESELEKQS